MLVTGLSVCGALTLSFFYVIELTEGDQEGVMDSLLEALSTGQAFRKEGRRRAPREKG